MAKKRRFFRTRAPRSSQPLGSDSARMSSSVRHGCARPTSPLAASSDAPGTAHGLFVHAACAILSSSSVAEADAMSGTRPLVRACSLSILVLMRATLGSSTAA